jgi:hypothetical protein
MSKADANMDVDSVLAINKSKLLEEELDAYIAKATAAETNGMSPDSLSSKKQMKEVKAIAITHSSENPLMMAAHVLSSMLVLRPQLLMFMG